MNKQKTIMRDFAKPVTSASIYFDHQNVARPSHIKVGFRVLWRCITSLMMFTDPIKLPARMENPTFFMVFMLLLGASIIGLMHNPVLGCLVVFYMTLPTLLRLFQWGVSEIMSEFVYVLKTSGMVECLDWDPTPKCGKGLHGFLNGCGDGHLASWEDDAKWLVLKVLKTDIVDLEGKVKFPRAEVIFAGSKREAIARLEELNPESRNMPVIGAERKGGNQSVVITGDFGTSTSGIEGESVSGDFGTSVSGDRGTSTSGIEGESVSGDHGFSVSGYCGKSVSGYSGKSVSGISGRSVSGYSGKSVSGDYGKSVSGYGGVVQAGLYGTLEIKFTKNGQEKSVIGKVGYNGIKPDTLYRLSKDRTRFVKA